MCMVDFADEDHVNLGEAMVRARKVHSCGECGREIAVGECYERAKMLVDTYSTKPRFFTFRTCQHCMAARQWLVKQCNGWLYEGVLEDLREHWDECWELRSMWLARAILGMHRKWQRRYGEGLLPVMGLVP